MYQEMWFPVAVVAGVTVILIFLAIVCLVGDCILKTSIEPLPKEVATSNSQPVVNATRLNKSFLG